MSGLSRRDLLKASAGAAAIAVPISALSSAGGSSAASTTAASAAASAGAERADEPDVLDVTGPVMFCVHDVARGEVSILHGTDEVIVQDRQLVNRIIRAAQARRAV